MFNFYNTAEIVLWVYSSRLRLINSFCTRGVSGWLPTTERHWQMAQRISGLEKPNMFVYGGGDDVAEWCKQHDVVHVKEFINRNREE